MCESNKKRKEKTRITMLSGSARSTIKNCIEFDIGKRSQGLLSVASKSQCVLREVSCSLLTIMLSVCEESSIADA